MSNGDPVSVSAQRLLTLRIIHLALALGCLVFAVVALYQRQQPRAVPPPPSPMVSYVGIAFTVAAGLAYLVVPGMLLGGWRRRLARGEQTETDYWNLLQTHFIVGAALLEGTVFFQLVAYLTEGQPWTLGIALFFWLLLLLKFPTESGARRWIETQRDQVELLRNSVT